MKVSAEPRSVSLLHSSALRTVSQQRAGQNIYLCINDITSEWKGIEKNTEERRLGKDAAPSGPGGFAGYTTGLTFQVFGVALVL